MSSVLNVVKLETAQKRAKDFKQRTGNVIGESIGLKNI
jgi:hypothetical protein